MQYAPIKTLCEKTGLCEKTIRQLIRKHGLPHHRTSPRGKILVDVVAFSRYMESTRVEVRRDPMLMEVLRELREFTRR
jgi:excisionase family DNA binding protein